MQPRRTDAGLCPVLQVGSDGCTYKFLLKGHEDLKQDERVMQLFGLINTLLAQQSKRAEQRVRFLGYFLMKVNESQRWNARKYVISSRCEGVVRLV